MARSTHQLLWKGRRRATWRLQASRLPAAFALTAVMVAGALLVVRWTVGVLPARWEEAWAADGWWVTLLLTTVVLTGALSDVTDTGADLWLRRRAVASTPTTRARVRRWLPLTRTLRGIGFMATWVYTSVGAWLVNTSELAPDDPVRDALLGVATAEGLPSGMAMPAAGYALGALVAEALRPAILGRGEDGRRGADLRPRDLAAYTLPLARWTPRLLALGLLATVWVAGGRDGPTLDGQEAVVTTVVALGVLEPARVWVVRRRQRAARPDVADVDDAARASTVHGISGAAIAVLGGTWSTYLQDLMLDWQGPARWFAWVSLVIGVGTIGLWAGLSTDLAWTVRRGGHPPPSGRRDGPAPAEDPGSAPA